VTEKQREKLLRGSYELGIRFFDTSPTYGDGASEISLGKYLNARHDVYIATKFGSLPHTGTKVPYDFSKKALVSSIDGSLTRLRRDVIDLIQLHSPILNFEKEYEDIFDFLLSIIRQGKVKKVGISLKSPFFFNDQKDLFHWKSFQYNLSILDQRFLSVCADKRFLENNSIIKIARTPLNFGFLTDNPPKEKSLTFSHHLRYWGHDQLRTWKNKSSKVNSITLKYGRSILETALRFPIDCGFSNIVLPGATTFEQMKNNFIQFNKQKLHKDLILELINFFKISEVDSIKLPHTYVNAGTIDRY
jgi:aryl-alcohol dehydrogenase-like predicted oxidoreductase